MSKTPASSNGTKSSAAATTANANSSAKNSAPATASPSAASSNKNAANGAAGSSAQTPSNLSSQNSGPPPAANWAKVAARAHNQNNNAQPPVNSVAAGNGPAGAANAGSKPASNAGSKPASAAGGSGANTPNTGSTPGHSKKPSATAEPFTAGKAIPIKQGEHRSVKNLPAVLNSPRNRSRIWCSFRQRARPKCRTFILACSASFQHKCQPYELRLHSRHDCCSCSVSGCVHHGACCCPEGDAQD